jgi:dUTP diphosphatase
MWANSQDSRNNLTAYIRDMDQLTVKVRRLRAEAILPKYSHSDEFGDLAADLYAAEQAELRPGEIKAIGTGIALEFPPDYGALIEDRSGLALKGIATLAGVIDPGFRGEVRVVLISFGRGPVTISTGDRIAQLRLVKRITAKFLDVSELSPSARSDGGFGSTGK